MRNIFLLALITLSLQSCIPFLVNTYFEPSSEQAKAEKSQCRGHTGPPDQISFHLNGVRFEVRTIETDQTILIDILIAVANGKSVIYPNGNFWVSLNGERSRIENIEIFDYALSPKGGWSAEALKNYDTLKRKLNQGETLLEGKYDITFEFPKTESFDIQLPRIIIDQIPFDFSVIHFSKKTATELFPPLNC